MTNYEVIDQFLADWKAKAKVYYLNSLELKEKALEEAREAKVKADNDPQMYKAVRTLYARGRLKDLTEHQIEVCNSLFSSMEKYNSLRSSSERAIIERLQYAKHPGSPETLEGKLNEILDREVASKKKKLIIRVEKKAGKIIDAGLLSIGHDGSLNGHIIGEEKTVKVNTIYAGGYNIQCLHYRVLVK